MLIDFKVGRAKNQVSGKKGFFMILGLVMILSVESYI